MHIRTLSIMVALGLVPVCLHAQEYTAYHGQLHAHTGVSDGDKSPAEAYAYARDNGKLDFFSVTDHQEQILFGEWDEIKGAADAAQVPGKYVTLYGYEWGSPIHNHINFLMTDKFYNVASCLSFNLSLIYDEIKKSPPALMQFNHPKYDPGATENNWDDFKYDAEIDQACSLIEVKNPITAGNDEEGHEHAYVEALDKGWHISPVSNQDNHGADWGTKNELRAGVWAEDFTRDGIVKAFQAGRTFATTDKNVTVRFLCEGQWMGESVETESQMQCSVLADDPDAADTFELIEVV
ncbi:MAG: CehA/McbA family metallohydrolase, partial [Myxococcota bacterium]